MKKHKHIHGFLAVLITVVFVFHSLPEINDHTYTTGIVNIHSYSSCLDRVPSHVVYHCEKFNCNY